MILIVKFSMALSMVFERLRYFDGVNATVFDSGNSPRKYRQPAPDWAPDSTDSTEIFVETSRKQ